MQIRNYWRFCVDFCCCKGEGSAPSQHLLCCSCWRNAYVWGWNWILYVTLYQTPPASKSSSTMPFPKKQTNNPPPAPSPPINELNSFCLCSKRRKWNIIICHDQRLAKNLLMLLFWLYAGKTGGKKIDFKTRNARNQSELWDRDTPASSSSRFGGEVYNHFPRHTVQTHCLFTTPLSCTNDALS